MPPGTYDTALTVTISDATPGAAIYYTTDGSAPTTASANYTGALTVSSTQTIKAMATASGRSTSAVAAATYTITGAAMPAAAAPTFSIPAGIYLSEQTVTISDATPGATIFYTTGGTPSLASTVYSSPILLNSTETIQALAVAPGYSASAVATATYTIAPPGPGEWAWIGGSSTLACGYTFNGFCAQPGVYGTLGTPAAGNVPGGREGVSTWTDSSGNLWLFGGSYESNSLPTSPESTDIYTTAYWNDLWEFSPTTQEWAWMSGSRTVPDIIGNSGQPGVYGTLGVPAAGNVPGGRQRASSWTDSSGNLWLFGGDGFDSTGNVWLSQRPMGVQSFHRPMGLDGRTQHVSIGRGWSIRHTGSSRCRKQSWGPIWREQCHRSQRQFLALRGLWY